MVPLDEQITGRSKAGLQLLLGAAGVVLLIGCVNITNLLLARSTQRRREIAVRSAIGASASRLLRQALAESTMLTAAGTVVGLVLAHVVLQTVLAYAPIDLPRMDEVRLDGRTFAFMALLAGITSLASGLLPAWHFARVDPQDAMKAVSRSATSGRTAGRLRAVLVASEVALSVICLTAAGLSAAQLRQADQRRPRISQRARGHRRFVAAWRPLSKPADARGLLSHSCCLRLRCCPEWYQPALRMVFLSPRTVGIQ